jgi:hypothetical protein
MKKRLVSILAAVCGIGALLAQTVPVQTATTYPSAGYSATNSPAAGGVAFSNRVGQVFSPEDLAAQLKNLKVAVDQTLPILSAFNEQYSNSSPGKQTVGSALSGIVSDVLHRNQSSQSGSSGQNTFSTSNLLSVLNGLLSTNSTDASGLLTVNEQDLKSLQSDLQPVEVLLQKLNAGSGTNGFVSPDHNGSQSYSPTGR